MKYKISVTPIKKGMPKYNGLSQFQSDTASEIGGAEHMMFRTNRTDQSTTY